MSEKLGIDILHDEIALLREKNAKFIAMLKQVTWVECDRGVFCSCCGEGPVGKHAKGCELAALLKETS